VNAVATYLAYGGGQHGLGVIIVPIVVTIAVIAGVVYSVVKSDK
jgi:hypothetical protein